METILKKLHIKNTRLYKISKNKIIVDGIDFNDKIFLNDKNDLDIDIRKLNLFIKKLNVTRLNHLGVSYSVKNLKAEIKNIKSNLNKYELYQEPNGTNKILWGFIGSKNIKDKKINPLFEVVLTETKSTKPTGWRPHFQIDYDTKKSYEEIVNISNEIFGKNILTWKLDIKDYGIVLAMGKIGSIGDVKIYLGIGTNLRNTTHHRKHLQKVK
jgi:hypothetical protein